MPYAINIITIKENYSVNENYSRFRLTGILFFFKSIE